MRTARLWPAAFASLAIAAAPAFAEVAGPPPPTRRAAPVRPVVEHTEGRQILSLESGNGRVVTLPAPAANVFVADPKVAEVRPASTNALFVFGVGPGRTTIAAMDADGHPVSQFEVTVRPSTFNAGEAEVAIAKLLPNSRVKVTPQARGLLLTGAVGAPADAARAVSILRGFLPEGQTVENQMSVQSSVQINLRVRMIEMNRSVIRALGVDFTKLGSGTGFDGLGARFGVVGTSAVALGAGFSPAGAAAIGTRNVMAMVQALSQDNLVRVLAEPNLTVMSGEPGSFLAGGEFPVPVGQQNGTITIDFKKYGVTLGVVPTVLSDGRINLHVNPEVSQLTDQGAVRLTAANTSLSIPALTVRRAETSVELGSGETFAIAGLLQDQSTQAINSIPFLGDLPVIGPLFRSSSYQRNETELVILVTPYIVRPQADPGAFRTPADRYTPPNDLERIALLRQVGATPSRVPARIPGAAGFVVQ